MAADLSQEVTSPSVMPSEGWTIGRIVALASGVLLLLLSLGLLAGGAFLAWADVTGAHVQVSSPVLPWLAGELLAASVFVAVPAALLILVPVRRATRRG